MKIALRLLLPLLAILAVLPAISGAQGGFRHPVAVSARVEPPSAKPGDTVRILVTSTISDPRYHIYALDPQGEGPMPTTIEVEHPALEPLGDWLEPTPTVKFDKGFQVDVASHYGASTTFERSFRVLASAEPGDTTTTGTFTVQACTESNCLPPRKIRFPVTLQIVGGAAAVPAAGTTAPGVADLSAATATPAAKTTPVASAPASSSQDALANRSLLGFILFAFGAGIASLATPCVFPMIPLTVSFFTKRAAKTRKDTIALATVYGGTIVLGFALFGFALAVILRMLGAGEQGAGFINRVAADPWVNLALTAVFIAFALSLFGMFDIALPSGIANKLQKAKGNRTDKIGAMLMALIFVVISFTCTAPIAGTLIVTAIGGDWLRPFVGLTAYGAGFALPFFLLSLFPSWLSSLPKAGGWMHSTKIVMGLLEIAAALKFLTNSALVWGWASLNREFLLAAWCAVAAAVTLYLFNFFRTPHDDEDRTVGPVRMLWGVSFASLTFLLIGGLSGARLPVFIEAYLPPEIPGASVAADGGSRSARKEAHLPFLQNDLAKAEALAKETGRPLFIDFTGVTCTNCRLMERDMLPRPAVEERLGRYVRVQLWTDVEPHGEALQEIQAARFGTIALPLYVAVSPTGETVAIEGYQTDEAKFLAFLDKGLGAAPAAPAEHWNP